MNLNDVCWSCLLQIIALHLFDKFKYRSKQGGPISDFSWVHTVCQRGFLNISAKSKTHMKLCPVSSTSYDLCTCKVWSCYVQRFRRKCIDKKYLIWPLVEVTWSIALYIMWPMYLQGLKLQRPAVNEMHLQENISFFPDPGVKVTWDVAQYPLHHVTYAPAEFDVATSHGWEDAFTPKYTLGSRSQETSTSCDLWTCSLKLLHQKV